jgi:hypothetical protein
MVLKCTGLTCQLLHVGAEFFVPILSKVLPLAKSSLARLSLVLSSDLPPCHQALGEHLLDDVDDDVVFVVGDAPSMSDTTSLGLAIGVHDLNMQSFVIIQLSPKGLTRQRNTKKIWIKTKKSGSQKKSGLVGRPTNPDLLQHD